VVTYMGGACFGGGGRESATPLRIAQMRRAVCQRQLRAELLVCFTSGKVLRRQHLQRVSWAWRVAHCSDVSLHVTELQTTSPAAATDAAVLLHDVTDVVTSVVTSSTSAARSPLELLRITAVVPTVVVPETAGLDVVLLVWAPVTITTHKADDFIHS